MNVEPELHDKSVLEFATYEDYLDQHVSAEGQASATLANGPPKCPTFFPEVDLFFAKHGPFFGGICIPLRTALQPPAEETFLAQEANFGAGTLDEQFDLLFAPACIVPMAVLKGREAFFPRQGPP